MKGLLLKNVTSKVGLSNNKNYTDWPNVSISIKEHRAFSSALRKFRNVFYEIMLILIVYGEKMSNTQTKFVLIFRFRESEAAFWAEQGSSLSSKHDLILLITKHKTRYNVNNVIYGAVVPTRAHPLEVGQKKGNLFQVMLNVFLNRTYVFACGVDLQNFIQLSSQCIFQITAQGISGRINQVAKHQELYFMFQCYDQLIHSSCDCNYVSNMLKQDSNLDDKGRKALKCREELLHVDIIAVLCYISSIIMTNKESKTVFLFVCKSDSHKYDTISISLFAKYDMMMSRQDIVSHRKAIEKKNLDFFREPFYYPVDHINVSL
ncbi:hypothetical protein Bhyg_14714 [Pseudolycoriella hygida]|uniref:Uncharacterized protein n=1 Tax=Pseudolycoriella hygida TaxID=35572 RepID=A0A9Q0MTN4_9DIPT|nr:hypothetical protein Bhyg_14714 [Pseudolycoriella hygida]